MAQWIRALASKPDKLDLIPRTHMVKGENHVIQAHVHTQMGGGIRTLF